MASRSRAGYLVWGDAKYVEFPGAYLLATWLETIKIASHGLATWVSGLCPLHHGGLPQQPCRSGFGLEPLLLVSQAMDLGGGLVRWYSIRSSQLHLVSSG